MTSFHNVRAPSATEHVAYRPMLKRDGSVLQVADDSAPLAQTR
jgi:hypothetical protein